jgi:hypothetical protein
MDIEEEEDDDDYGLYIEELKSENPNLKFNAAQKIVNVSKVLGISLNLFSNLKEQKGQGKNLFLI